MNNFIELTLNNGNKCLINTNVINCVWTQSGNTMVSTNSDLEGDMYQESYEEVKEMILRTKFMA
jgi:hypothetical protein